MSHCFRYYARAACALPLLACGSERGPTSPIAESAERLVPALEVSSVGPSPEELAAMPAEFRKNPTILEARTMVDFVPPDGAYAQAYMKYFATDAEQDVTLTLRFDNRQVATKTNRSAQEDFLPGTRTLWTNVTLGVTGSCGHLADGQGAHRAWHKALISGWRFLTWGRAAVPSDAQKEQPPCPEPPPEPEPVTGPGGGGESYVSGCVSCQQWLWYDRGQVVDEWWECTPVDAYRCDNRAT